MPNKAIIFDLDGTLWNAGKQAVLVWNSVFAQFNLNFKINEDDLTSLMGLPLEEIGAILLPQLEKNELKTVLEACSEGENAYLRQKGAQLYPLVEKTLKELKEQGYSLYIVSNCQEGYIEAFLEYYKFEELFRDISCAGKKGLSKGQNIIALIEANNIKRAIYVGDTLGDQKAAEFAQIPFVYASYGFGQGINPLFSIANISQLPHLINEHEFFLKQK